MNPESFKNKLYIARNVEGDPNNEDLALLHSLQEKLADKKGFVGIAPFGSIVTGYSSTESDFDLVDLYDDPDDYPDARNGNIGNELWMEILKLTDGLKRKINIFGQNVNLELFLHSMENGVSNDYLIAGLAQMSGLVTGEKIADYRKKLTLELENLPTEEKTDLLNKVVDYLFEQDAKSLTKRKKRMPNLTEEEHQNILSARKDMWEKRVKEVWNL